MARSTGSTPGKGSSDTGDAGLAQLATIVRNMIDLAEVEGRPDVLNRMLAAGVEARSGAVNPTAAPKSNTDQPVAGTNTDEPEAAQADDSGEATTTTTTTTGTRRTGRRG